MKRILIFEGADGCGKTTLAKAVAARLGVVYHHHGPYPAIACGLDLVNVYAASVAPALRDHSHVVLDRCWVSEVPYGLAYRSGADRLGVFRREYLDRETGHAERYLCLPPYKTALKNFMRGDQYLENVSQFRQVYEWYEACCGFSAIDPFDGRDHVGEIVDGL